jgi:multicomponent K+:H+ antiporter subunit D
MSLLTALPVLLPLLGGILLLFLRPAGIQKQRVVHLLLIAGLVIVTLIAFFSANKGGHQIMLLGNWQAPFGIVIVLDRLSSIMLLLTATLASGALWYAIKTNVDRQGEHFHVLFQLQLFGLNGAFLTGDVFNLFVFFEILLLASYGLLLHGGGRLRTRAGLHYVVINLVGSTLFLFAVGALYGMLGTLNIADMSVAVQNVPAEDRGVVAAAGLLLLVVFGVKAAMFPLYLWLPRAYAYTSAPVAALFAIMTKVGLYAIIRVHGTVFGEEAGALAFIHSNWVLAAGLITSILAAFGVMASTVLRQQVAYLVLASVGILLIAIGLNSEAALSAAIYYLVHSTLLGAALFLLADVIFRARGNHGDTLVKATPVAQPILVGSVFMLLVIAMTGMPPLSGFFGKVMVLDAALAHPWFIAILLVVLVSGLLMIISVARTGSLLFYSAVKPEPNDTPPEFNRLAFAAIIGLLMTSPLLVAFAKPISAVTEHTAMQLYDSRSYVSAVLSARPVGKER